MTDQPSLLDREDVVALRAAWEVVLRQLKSEVPETVMARFLRPLKPASLNEATAVFDAPGQFVLDWVRDKYLDRLEEALAEVIGSPRRIELRGQLRERPADPVRASGMTVSRNVSTEPRAGFTPNPKYRFETFVVGQSNRLAFAGARAIAAAPGVKYNPLFIYGASGLGKTHLMHAITHEIHVNDPGLAVKYMSAQQFAEEFVFALQNNRIDQFRKAQRGVGVWLLDDVQFVAGKERTQEEVFHTFNYLQALNRQIVLCSDRPPRDLLLMDERLRSRFESSLVTDVQMPDTETRCAILLSKAEHEGLPLGHDVAMFLAESVPGNVRILEGALTKLAAEASLEGGELGSDLARAIVDKYYTHIGVAKPSFDQIVTTVSRHYKIPIDEIKGISRKAPIAHARHIAVFMTRDITGDSWKHIGALFGNRDHTSMMHGYKKVRDLMNCDKELNATVRMLIRDIWPEV